MNNPLAPKIIRTRFSGNSTSSLTPFRSLIGASQTDVISLEQPISDHQFVLDNGALMNFAKSTPEERMAAFWSHYNNADGDDVTRTCRALMMLELENDYVRQTVAQCPIDQRQTFSQAYECFVLWLMKDRLSQSGNRDAADRLMTMAIRDRSKSDERTTADFTRVWQAVQLAMPDAFKGGRRFGVPMPWVHVVAAINDAGLPLAQCVGLNFAAHIAIMCKRITGGIDAVIASSTAPPDPTTNP